jgi:hypothetical protein
MINGFQVSQAICAAVTLGLPDLLAGGPRRAEVLATETKTDARSLYRLLRALGAFGILSEQREGDSRQFGLTELGELLRTDVSGSLAGWAALVARPSVWAAWGNLLHAVRTGEDAFAGQHGESVWAWRKRRPDESRIFDRAMSAISATVSTRLAQNYDFAKFSSLADLGGGDGTLLATVLSRYPGLRGVLFDLPHVVCGATERLAAAGVSDRCEVVSGSFFDRVPPGCDAYVLKSILHDWDDTSALRILRNVRDATAPGSVLVIVERTMTELAPTTAAGMTDLNMMVITGGVERTMSEWSYLAEESGFAISGAVDIGVNWSAIEAIRT